VGLNIARSKPAMWFAAYLPCLIGGAIVWFLLFWAARPYLFRRKPLAGGTI